MSPQPQTTRSNITRVDDHEYEFIPVYSSKGNERYRYMKILFTPAVIGPESGGPALVWLASPSSFLT